MIFLSKRSLFPNHVTYVAGPHSLVSVVLAAIARVRWTEKLLSNCYQSYLTVFCSQEAEKLVDTQLAMVHSSQREQKPSSSLQLFFVGKFTVTVTMEECRCSHRTMDQSDGIYNSYSMVARDLWQCKPPVSSDFTLELGSVYCHKSLAPCYNYNKNLYFLSDYLVLLILDITCTAFSSQAKWTGSIEGYINVRLLSTQIWVNVKAPSIISGSPPSADTVRLECFG